MTKNNPEFLYKYRPVTNAMQVKFVEDIIRRHQFYFAPIHHFLDPFEFRIEIATGNRKNGNTSNLADLISEESGFNKEKTKDILEKIYKEIASLKSKEISDVNKAIVRHWTSSVGVLSLSENIDNMLMWSYYADWHNGVCMGFRVSPDCKFFSRARKVRYSENYPCTEDINLRPTVNCCLYKSLQWSHEREWRIVEDGLGGKLIDYPSEKLEHIVLGIRTSSEVESIVREWIGSASQKIKLFKAKVSDSSHNIILDEI
jgi:hypothetical protein